MLLFRLAEVQALNQKATVLFGQSDAVKISAFFQAADDIVVQIVHHSSIQSEHLYEVLLVVNVESCSSKITLQTA
jgi:hypothetical protein